MSISEICSRLRRPGLQLSELCMLINSLGDCLFNEIANFQSLSLVKSGWDQLIEILLQTNHPTVRHVVFQNIKYIFNGKNGISEKSQILLEMCSGVVRLLYHWNSNLQLEFMDVLLQDQAVGKAGTSHNSVLASLINSDIEVLNHILSLMIRYNESHHDFVVERVLKTLRFTIRGIRSKEAVKDVVDKLCQLGKNLDMVKSPGDEQEYWQNGQDDQKGAQDDKKDAGEDPEDPEEDPEDPEEDPEDPEEDPEDPEEDPEDSGEDPEDSGEDPEDPEEDPEDSGEDPEDPRDGQKDPRNDQQERQDCEIDARDDKCERDESQERSKSFFLSLIFQVFENVPNKFQDIRLFCYNSIQDELGLLFSEPQFDSLDFSWYYQLFETGTTVSSRISNSYPLVSYDFMIWVRKVWTMLSSKIQNYESTFHQNLVFLKMLNHIIQTTVLEAFLDNGQILFLWSFEIPIKFRSELLDPTSQTVPDDSAFIFCLDKILDSLTQFLSKLSGIRSNSNIQAWKYITNLSTILIIGLESLNINILPESPSAETEINTGSSTSINVDSNSHTLLLLPSEFNAFTSKLSGLFFSITDFFTSRNCITPESSQKLQNQRSSFKNQSLTYFQA
ncbi:Cna B-type domain-containing protein [Cryptosporidium felis]|nr:Cna B-type domain-containing protein [Cryptosporidium felis]